MGGFCQHSVKVMDPSLPSWRVAAAVINSGTHATLGCLDDFLVLGLDLIQVTPNPCFFLRGATGA